MQIESYINIVKTYVKNCGTAIVRCDFNVPSIKNISKIYDIVETMNLLKNNKVILITHWGNIDFYDEKYSLVHLVNSIELVLKEKVSFCNTIEEAKNSTCKINLLENLRFHKEEKNNDENFAKNLASMGDFYINDAFACSHRKHSSINAIRKYIKSFLGVNMSKQIEKLSPLLQKNYIWIVGGKKIRTKLNSIPKNSKIILGGVAANSYYKYMGFEIGKSYAIDYEMNEHNFFPPKDIVTNSRTTKIENIKSDESIIDVGPKTILYWQSILKNNPCIWNGSISMNEKSENQMNLLKFVSKNCFPSIVGGGNMQIENDMKFTHCSTAGGALLHFMSHGSFDCMN